MTQQEIRYRQEPLVERYKNRPDFASVTLTARGELGENLTCRIKTGDFFKEAGLHRASGGSGIHVWPADMLLESIAACAGVTLNMIAALYDIKLNQASVTAEGELDFRGTLGIEEDAPVGFQSLRLRFEIESDEDEKKIKDLITRTQKYCVVYQTLKNTPEIEISVNEIKSVNV